jgi:hypothetical protein
MQQSVLARAKSLAGVFLAGLGLFIFCQNLDHLATQGSRLLEVIPRQATAELPGVVLAAARVLQTYTNDRRCLLDFLHHSLAPSSLLPAVVFGAVFCLDSLVENVSPLRPKSLPPCRTPSSPFDAKVRVTY